MSDNKKNELKLARALQARLDERVGGLEKTFKVSLLIGLVIIFVVVAYMNYLYQEFKEVMQPSTMAEFVANEVKRRIPSAGRELEGNLKAKAPEIVKSIKDTVVNESVPTLRKMLEGQLRDSLDEFFRTAPDLYTNEVYRNLLKHNKARLLGAAAKDSTALMDVKFQQSIKAGLTKALKDDTTETLTSKLDQSVAALKKINMLLKRLGAKGKLNREEKLVKRLISTWWTMFDPKTRLTKRDMKEAKDNIRKSTDELFEGARPPAKKGAPTPKK